MWTPLALLNPVVEDAEDVGNLQRVHAHAQDPKVGNCRFPRIPVSLSRLTSSLLARLVDFHRLDVSS